MDIAKQTTRELHKAVNYASDRISSQLDHAGDGVQSAISKATDVVEQKLEAGEKLVDRVAPVVRDRVDATRKSAEDLSRVVSEDPLKAMLIAAVSGLVVGALISRLSPK